MKRFVFPAWRRDRRMKGFRPRRLAGTLVVLFAGLTIMTYFRHTQPELPPGVNIRGTLYPVAEDDIRLFFDTTAREPQTMDRVIRQDIFDTALAMIANAQRYVLADFFLWNGWQGAAPEEHRRLSTELANALIARKQAVPDLAILAISDPINRVYGDGQEPFFEAMAAAGIPVIFTDLDRLPDSNMIYAPPARRIGGLLSRSAFIARRLARPRWPNLLDRDGGAVSTYQIGRLLLFKANHRKVLITDGPAGQPRLLITSMNPADGSSAHDNIALRIDGAVAREALENELVHADWSAERSENVLQTAPGMGIKTVQTLRNRIPTDRANRAVLRVGKLDPPESPKLQPGSQRVSGERPVGYQPLRASFQYPLGKPGGSVIYRGPSGICRPPAGQRLENPVIPIPGTLWRRLVLSGTRVLARPHPKRSCSGNRQWCRAW